MIWDGTSKTRRNPNVRRAPDGWDYARSIAEIQQLQREITPIYAVAYSNLDAFRLVSLRVGGQVEYADFNISSCVFGMTRGSVQAGQLTPLAVFGVLTATDWTGTVGSVSLSPGREYFLATTGGMALECPTSGYLIKVGRALSHTEFLLKIEASVRLA